MALALDTLKAVGDKANDQEAVASSSSENTKGRDSVLGTYDIDENGDTTLTDYGLYVIKDGQPTFDKVIKARAARPTELTRNGAGAGLRARPRVRHSTRTTNLESASAPAEGPRARPRKSYGTSSPSTG